MRGKCPNHELLLRPQGRRTAALFCAHGPLGGLARAVPAARLPRPETPLPGRCKRPTQMTCPGSRSDVPASTATASTRFPPAPAHSGGEGPRLRAAAAATSAVCYNDSALRYGACGQRQRRGVVKQTIPAEIHNKPTSCESLSFHVCVFHVCVPAIAHPPCSEACEYIVHM